MKLSPISLSALARSRRLALLAAMFFFLASTEGQQQAQAADDNLLAHQLYQQGQFTQAAEIFTDPAWKGVALYRSEQWWRAAEAFIRADDARSAYNLGNCYVKLGYFALALDAYQRSLALQPGMKDAEHNAELMRTLLAQDDSNKERSGRQASEDEIDNLDTDEEASDSGTGEGGTEDSSAGEPAPGETEEGRISEEASDKATPGDGGAASEEIKQSQVEADGGAAEGAAGEADPESRSSGEAESGLAADASQAAGLRSAIEDEQATAQWLNQIQNDSQPMPQDKAHRRAEVSGKQLCDFRRAVKQTVLAASRANLPVTSRYTLLMPFLLIPVLLISLLLMFAPFMSALFLSALFIGQAYAQSSDFSDGITLTIDTDSLYLGDSVTLDVEAIGLIEPLDISPLLRNAELLAETVGTRIAVVNGKVVEVKLQHMELLPKREGLMIFGPINGEAASGTVSSNSVALTVGPPVDRSWTPTDQDVRLSLNLSSDAPMVGEMIVADVVLRHRHAIAEESISLPKFEGFDVLEVYVARRTLDPPEADESGDRPSGGWRRIAWRYLLWPRNSGAMTIDALSWSGTMIQSRSQRGKFERKIDAQSISVSPAPVSAGQWWLPASGVKLESEWSGDLKSLSAGDQIIRNITLTATNVLASALPEVVPLESRALSSTRIEVKRSQQLIGDTLTATALFRFRLTAQSPIPVFLDTVRVDWWDTQSRESREAIIPARRINVGLPEREDLLADLAASQHWWDRAWLSLQSLRVGRSIPWISLALLLVVLLSLLLAPLWRSKQSKNLNTSALPGL